MLAAVWDSRNTYRRLTKAGSYELAFAVAWETNWVGRVEIAVCGIVRTWSITLKDKQREKRRNIPVHIFFWVFVIFLLYMFWKAFSGHNA